MKLASIEALVRALNAEQVPFLVVGGLAVVAHGYGRQTLDVDLVVQLSAAALGGAFRALATLGYQPRVPVSAADLSNADVRRHWIAEKGMRVLNFHSDHHRETPVDVFVTEPFDFEEEHRRALLQEIAPGAPVRIVRLQTLLRMKQEAGRMQDLADIAELRLANPGGANDA